MRTSIIVGLVVASTSAASAEELRGTYVMKLGETTITTIDGKQPPSCGADAKHIPKAYPVLHVGYWTPRGRDEVTVNRERWTFRGIVTTTPHGTRYVEAFRPAGPGELEIMVRHEGRFASGVLSYRRTDAAGSTCMDAWLLQGTYKSP